MKQLYAATFILFVTENLAALTCEQCKPSVEVRTRLAMDFILSDTSNSTLEYWKWILKMPSNLMMPNDIKPSLGEFLKTILKNYPKGNDPGDPRLLKLLVLILNKESLYNQEVPDLTDPTEEQEAYYQKVISKLNERLFEYENELDSLKDITLSDKNVTLYDFLYMEDEDASKYARSEVFKKLNNEEAFRKKFRNYGYIVFMQYERAYAKLIKRESRYDL